MNELLAAITTNQLAFALAAVAALLAVVWLRRRARSRAGTRSASADVLDAGAAPAQRNQALIDAPSAVAAALGGAEDQTTLAAPAPAPADPAVAAAAPKAALPDAAPSAPAPGADDLSRIKGLGPKLQALLPTLGLSTYAQIAALTEADLAALDGKLGAFAGRPARDKWAEQARYLAAGDAAGFEAAFGKL